MLIYVHQILNWGFYLRRFTKVKCCIFFFIFVNITLNLPKKFMMTKNKEENTPIKERKGKQKWINV